MQEQAKYNDISETEESGGVATKAGEALKELINRHWSEIEDSWGDEPKMGVSVALTLRKESGTTKVTTKIAFAKTVKDEREDYVDDPDQETIRFDG